MKVLDAETGEEVEIPAQEVQESDSADISEHELSPGKEAPKVKPTRDRRGIHLSTLRQIRIEISKVYRLWWRNEIDDKTLETASKVLDKMIKVRTMELAAEAAGRQDDADAAKKEFAGLIIKYASNTPAKGERNA